MAIHQFVKDLQTVLIRQQGEIANKLMNGAGISNHEDYKHQTGIAKGLGQAADIAYQLMKQRDMADDPDGQLPEMPDEPDKPTPPKVPAKKRGGRR